MRRRFPGIRIAIIYVRAPEETVAQRVEERARRTGRGVPEDLWRQSLEQAETPPRLRGDASRRFAEIRPRHVRHKKGVPTARFASRWRRASTDSACWPTSARQSGTRRSSGCSMLFAARLDLTHHRGVSCRSCCWMISLAEMASPSRSGGVRLRPGRCCGPHLCHISAVSCSSRPVCRLVGFAGRACGMRRRLGEVFSPACTGPRTHWMRAAWLAERADDRTFDILCVRSVSEWHALREAERATRRSSTSRSVGTSRERAHNIVAEVTTHDHFGYLSIGDPSPGSPFVGEQHLSARRPPAPLFCALLNLRAPRVLLRCTSSPRALAVAFLRAAASRSRSFARPLLVRLQPP